MTARYANRMFLLSLLAITLALALSQRANAQWTTPTIDGSFDGPTVYPNSLASDGRTWYVTWNNTNLYVFVQGAGAGNRVLMYFDTDPSVPVNGGATGSVVGIDYSNTNLVRLPFSAEAFVALETGYRQLNTAFPPSTTFSSATNVTSAPGWAFAESGGNFEAQIPWSAISPTSSRPAAFNWFGYITDNSPGGNYFSKVPTANPGGILGTTLPNATNTAGYERYFKITNTGNSTSTDPFSLDCYTFVRHTGTDATGFGAITVEDFTMNTSGRSIIRAASGTWTINGTLRVANGTVDFGACSDPCNANNVVVSSGATLTLSTNAGGVLNVAGNYTCDGTLTPNNRPVTLNGTGPQNLSGSNLTFYDLVVNNAGTSTTTFSSYSAPNRTAIQSNLTVSNVMSIKRGVVWFASGTGLTLNHTLGNLALGSNQSFLTITLTSITSNTEFIVNNGTNCNVTLTVNGNITLPADSGGATGAITSPGAEQGSAILTVNGNINAVDTLIFSLNGRINFVTSNPTPNPIRLNVGTPNTAGTGNLIMSNKGNVFLSNTSGTLTPTVNLRGGTLASPATYDIKFAAFDSNFVLITTGNANMIMNIDGVYEVAPGASVCIGDKAAARLRINNRLIVPDDAEIAGTDDGSGVASPTLEMGANGVLVVQDLNGLGDGTSTTPLFAFCVNRRTAQANWNLTSINANGTVQYSATTAGTQTVTPRTYNILRIERSGSNYSSTPIPTGTFINPCVATGNLTVDTLQVALGVLALTNASGTFTHSVGTLELGSSSSTTSLAGTNTGVFVNKDDGATSTLTVSGTTTVVNGQVSLTLSAFGTSITSTTLNLNGDLSAGSNTIWLSGHTSSGSPTTNITFGGNVTLSNTSRFNANPTGTVTPTITLGTASATRTWNVPPVVLLGTPPTEPSNVRCNWVVPATATVQLPSGSAIAVMGGFNLTLNGTLDCADGAELISTFTGPGSGNPTLLMGASGTIRVADVDGLGDGTILDPSSNFPLFIRRSIPSSPTPTNWILSSINSNGTIEYNGTGQTVTPRNTLLSNNYNNLIFSGGNKTLGGGDVDVNGTLALNGGIITTGSNEIRSNNGALAAVTRTAGHINGRLSRLVNTTSGDRLYPIGDATTYRQITLPTETSSGSSLLRGEVISGNANSLASVNSPLVAVSFLRYYQFTNAGSEDITVSGLNSVQVSGDDEVGSLNPNNTLRLSSRTTGNWVERTLTAAPNTTSLPIQISASSFTETVTNGGGNFFVSLATTNLGDNPLPVELLSFTATSTAQGVRLAWETASEHESNGFTLLRREQGEMNWTEIASYQTAPELRAQNSPSGASYAFIDNARLEVGKAYEYQLVETGFDGQTTRFEPISLVIRFNAARGYELAQNYPNPFNPMTTIRYQIPEGGFVSLKVYDVLGKEVATLVNGAKEAGSHWVSFNASGLASGVYFYRLQAGGFAETRKMMLVK